MLLVAVTVFSIGWYYADEILRSPGRGEAVHDVTVVATGDSTVTLERTPETARPGVWGVAWPDGYARVGALLDQGDDRTVTRRLVPITGTLEPGDQVRIDPAAYPAAAADAFFFPTERVTIDGPDGALPADLVIPDVVAPDDERTAWRTGGPRNTWAVLVHGRGATRRELFRILPALRDLGLPALVIGYRDDHDAPASPGGRSGLGWTEWRDVEAGTDYAFARGASDVVLVGSSMGGAIVASYLHRSGDADRVVGVVLDSPVLAWGPVLRAAADQRGVPRWVRPVAQAIITLRTGLRWRDLDQVSRAEEFETPMLLFHGTADATVPVTASDAFAAARPDLVTYVRVRDAGHGNAWNADPHAYAGHLRRFLTGLLD